MKPSGARAGSVIPVNRSPVLMETVIIIDSDRQQIEKGNLYISILASSSKGNAIFVSDASTSILVDAGLSGKQVELKLESIGFSPKNLDAILVSHEHSDHIQGVGVLSRRYKLPVYISTRTLTTASKQLGKLHSNQAFECGKQFTIGTLAIHPFSVSHDAKDPACFTIKQNGLKIGIATDLGLSTSVVREHLKGCNTLVLEANHDPVMLEEGPYPWPLKQRIKGRTGHLSNEDAKKLLEEVKHEGLTHVVLSHLSETNNTPEKASATVGKALKTDPNIKLIVAS